MFIYKKTCIKRNVAFLLIFIARYTYSFRGESTSVTRWNIKIKYYQFWILIDSKYFLHPFAHFAIIISLKLNLNLRQTSSLICNPLFIIFSTQSGLTVSVFYVTYCTTYSLFFRISIIDQFASLIRNLSYRSFLKTDLISKTKAIKRTKAIYQKHRSTWCNVFSSIFKIVYTLIVIHEMTQLLTKTCPTIFKSKLDRSASEPNREQNFHFHPSSRPQLFIFSSLPVPLHACVEKICIPIPYRPFHTFRIQIIIPVNVISMIKHTKILLISNIVPFHDTRFLKHGATNFFHSWN